MTETTTQSVFKSQWGFHPCSRETLKKLKQIRVYHMHNEHQQARLERWLRKEPQNRIQILDGMGFVIPKADRKKNPIPWAKPELLKLDGVDWDIENARHPKATADAVKPMSFTEEEIDEMLATARLWYLEKCPRPRRRAKKKNS